MKPEHKLMCAIFGLPAQDDIYHEEVDGISLHDALMEALDSIKFGREGRDRRDKAIILMRFGFGSADGRRMTLEEVGQQFWLTKERIRQIEAKTLRLLRHPSRTRKLRSYFESLPRYQKEIP